MEMLFLPIILVGISRYHWNGEGKRKKEKKFTTLPVKQKQERLKKKRNKWLLKYTFVWTPTDVTFEIKPLVVTLN